MWGGGACGKHHDWQQQSAGGTVEGYGRGAATEPGKAGGDGRASTGVWVLSEKEACTVSSREARLQP
jgi:hypothetical protein